MGGPGSGSWYRWNKRGTVNDGLSLDINQLGRDGLIVQDYAAGSLRWQNTYTGEETASIGFILEPLGEDGLTMRLHYTRTGRNGEKDNLTYSIVLQTNRPHYGGRRYWFTCPLTVNGWPCRRRVGKLYLPPGGKYFGFRHCYNLTYKSCQESDKRINFYGKNPAAMKAAMDGDRLSTESFLALRSFFRIMRRLKDENEKRQAKRRGGHQRTHIGKISKFLWIFQECA
jgi:hypothetical protein